MDKVIVFTDIHLLGDGGTIIGLDPAAKFAQGLAHALAHHPDAAQIVIAGDLAHTGQRPEYQRLAECLARCPLPVNLMMGNHDRRAPFLSVFTDTPLTAQGHVQQVVDLGDTRLILLDTLDEDAPDVHSGYLCDARLDWLDARLQEARRAHQRVIVFTHHPPMPTGFAGMDSIGLRNRAALVARLTASGGVAQIVSGHIHRTISGSAGGIPTAMFKSTCHQMPMLLNDAAHSLSIDEPGAYGVLLLHPDGIIVHSEDFTLPQALVDRRDSNPEHHLKAQITP
ncbi:MAG: phosphodiesterase [Roseovarius sp.]